MPQVAIILPVYNTAKYLDRCINSIVNQTFKDFVLIAINDGSNDNSLEILDKWKKSDDRIIIIDQENRGISDVRNIGIKYITENIDAKYVCFIDSDDYVSDIYLEYLNKAKTENSNTIVACSYKETTKDNEKCADVYNYKILYTKEYYVENNTNSTVSWNKMYQVEDFSDIQYPSGKLYEDESTTFKILFKYKTIIYIDVPLYFYYQNPGSIMNKKWTPRNMERLDALKEKIYFFKEKNIDDLYMHDVKKLITTSIRYYRNIKRKYQEYLYLKNDLTVDIRKYLIDFNKKYTNNLLSNIKFELFVYFYWLYASFRIYLHI